MSRSNILYIEDEEPYQTLVQQILGEEGFDVHTAGTGAEGRVLLERLKPQLIILDINLPDTDGYTLCKGLREEEIWSKLPVLMLTVRRRPEEWRQGFSSGASDYLSKPLNGPDLIQRVRSCMKGKLVGAEISDNPEVLMIQSAITGNKAAYDVFVRQYKDILLKNVLNDCRNIPEAEDIVSTTFIRAYEHLHQFRGQSNFYTWLYIIARRELLHRRRDTKSVSVQIEELTDAEQITASLTESLALPTDWDKSEDPPSNRLEEALKEVPRDYRRPLELYYVEGLPYDSIARRLNIPQGTVMSRLHRGKTHLRKAWERISGNTLADLPNDPDVDLAKVES